jgi:hypothetical protein
VYKGAQLLGRVLEGFRNFDLEASTRIQIESRLQWGFVEIAPAGQQRKAHLKGPYRALRLLSNVSNESYRHTHARLNRELERLIQGAWSSAPMERPRLRRRAQGALGYLFELSNRGESREGLSCGENGEA